MNKKQALVLSLSALISFGGLANGGVALAEETKNQNLEVVECVFEDLSFEDFMKDMPTKDITKDDMKKLNSLYNQCGKLEKDNKLDEANKKWNEFDKILSKYFDKDNMVVGVVVDFENLSFEDLMKDMPTKDIPKNDMKKLKTLYNDLVKFEQDNKLDDADKKWDEFYKILEKYIDDKFVTFESMELPSFDEFIKDMATKKIPTADMEKLKNLYNDITKLEKDNKFDDADKKWNKFDKILDKYLDEQDKNSL